MRPSIAKSGTGVLAGGKKNWFRRIRLDFEQGILTMRAKRKKCPQAMVALKNCPSISYVRVASVRERRTLSFHPAIPGWKNLFLPPPEDATSPHIKKEVGSLSSPNFGTLYGNLDPTHPERGESNKRSKLGSAFRASTPPLIPVSIDGGSRHGTPFALHRPSLMDMRATMSSSSPQSTPSLLGIDAE